MLERPPTGVLVESGRPPEVTVVGVIGNTKNAGFRDEPAPVVLMPYTLIAPLQRTLACARRVIRAADNPIRAQLRAMDSEQPLGRAITLDEVLAQQVVQPRFTMSLFGAFAAMGLALAAAGIYSVLSFHVARRTQELGFAWPWARHGATCWRSC